MDLAAVAARGVIVLMCAVLALVVVAAVFNLPSLH